MKHIKNLAALLSLLALVFAGCSQPLAAPSAAKSATGGSLTITIPTVAPWLAQAVAQGTSGSRAFLHAAKAEVTLYQQIDVTGDVSKDWSQVAGPLALTFQVDGSGTALSGELTGLPPGHGYRVKVAIWAQSTDTTPTVEGISDNVWIDVYNTNNVNVGCLPVSPTKLDLTAASSVPIATTNIAAGAEVWYAFQVLKNKDYRFQFTSTNGAVGFVFSGSGNRWMTLNNGNSNTFKAWDSTVIYLGVSGAATAGTFGVTAEFVPGSPLTGNVAFPAGSVGKKYRFTTWSDNGYSATSEGTVDAGLTASVNLGLLPPGGLYTFFGKLEGTVPWSGDTKGPAKDGDLTLKAQAFGSDGFNAVNFFDAPASDWSPVIPVTWNAGLSQYVIEPGAHLVVGVDSRSLGDAILSLWNTAHPGAKDAVRYMDIGSDTALDHNASRDGLQSDVTLAVQNSLLAHQNNAATIDSHLLAAVVPELDPDVYQWVNANFKTSILGLPIAYDGMAFAWNKTMLTALKYDLTDANGDGLPEAFDTWEEIFAIAKAWNNPTYNNKAITVVYPLSLDEPWSGYAGVSAGGWRIFGTKDATKPGFDSPDFLKGLEFLKAASDASLSREGDGSKTSGGGMYWRWDGFLKDDLSPFGMVGTWMDITGAKTKSGEDIVISRMPTWQGTKPAPLLKAKVYTVDKGSYFPSAAMELLRLLYTKEGIQAMVNNSSYGPTLKAGSTLTPAYAADSPQPQFTKAFALAGDFEPLNLVLPSGQVAMNVYYNIGINQVYKDVWDGVATPDLAQQVVVAKASNWLVKNQ